MRNPFKSLSTFSAGPPVDAGTQAAAQPAAAPLSAPLPGAQHALALRGDPGPTVGAMNAVQGTSSRALRAVSRASTSVAISHPQAHSHAHVLMPTTHAAHGVALTQTERVRLRIMQAQIKLASLMLYEGPIDGMLNLETVAGLRHFQTLKGLRETGQVTAATLRALGVPVD